MRIKTINSQALLECLCFTLFGGLLFYLVSSKKYLTYVTPRMMPYLYFASIIMIIWAITRITRLFKPQHRVRSHHCFVLGFPILLLLLPHAPLTTSNFSGNNSNVNKISALAYQDLSVTPASAAQSKIDNSDLPVLSNELPDSSLEDATSDVELSLPNTDDISSVNVLDASQPVNSETQFPPGLTGLDVAHKQITVSNDDFSMWLTELFTNMNAYEGYTINITGYVYKDSSTYNENEFIPARLMMSCCVADLSPVGITCEYDKVSELKEDSWVTVNGTLQVGEYEYDGKKYQEPQIVVNDISPSKEVNEYIYPFY